MMPVISLITDSKENLEKIFAGARVYLLPGTLYLRGATRKLFMEFVQREFPGITTLKPNLLSLGK